MLSISALARESDLPRTSIEWWCNEGLLQPVDPFSVKTHMRRYSSREREIARLLRPFHIMKSPLPVLRLMALTFRHLLDEHARSAEEENNFGPLIAAAREGRQSALAVKIFEVDRDLRAAIVGGMGPDGVLDISDPALKDVLGPIVTINLTEALAPASPHAARWAADDESAGRKS